MIEKTKINSLCFSSFSSFLSYHTLLKEKEEGILKRISLILSSFLFGASIVVSTYLSCLIGIDDFLC